MPSIDLAAALAVLYPAAQLPFDYVVADDGVGPQIVRWDEAKLGAQPTDDALAAAAFTALKQARCNAIDIHTQTMIASGFTFDGHSFSLSAEAQLNLTAMFAFQAELTFPRPLTTSNNNAYAIADLATLQALCATAFAAKDGAIDSGRDLKVAINAAVDAAAVDAIVDTR